MELERADEIMDMMDIERYSHECDAYGRIVIWKGEYWLALHEYGMDRLVDRIDDPWNVDDSEVNEVWA